MAATAWTENAPYDSTLGVWDSSTDNWDSSTDTWDSGDTTLLRPSPTTWTPVEP